jgi:HEAT repeat protein
MQRTLLLALVLLLPTTPSLIGAETTKIMIDALASPKPPVRLQAIRNLSEAGRTALPELVIALSHENPTVQVGAAAALKGMKRDAAMAAPALTTALADPSSAVRAAAADALAFTAPSLQGCREPLLRSLRDPAPSVCGLAAIALGRLAGADKEVHNALIRSLEEGNAQAAWALGRLGGEGHASTVLPALTEALWQESTAVQLAAIRALQSMKEKARRFPPLPHGPSKGSTRTPPQGWRRTVSPARARERRRSSPCSTRCRCCGDARPPPSPAATSTSPTARPAPHRQRGRSTA